MARDSSDERFTHDGKFRRDPKRQRATFGVAYPSEDLRFNEKTDIPRHQQKILGRRLTFKIERQTFTAVEFEECNFHNQHGQRLSRIAHLTFDNCLFRRSIMGTTAYVRCRFRRCTFSRCDFAFAEFQDCTFEECEFLECTANDAVFERTEIDPDAFMKSLEEPLYNYDKWSLLERQQLRTYMDDVRFRVASRLLRANSDVSHRFYTDSALRLLKWEELRYRRNRLEWNSALKGSSRLVGWLLAVSVYGLTSGGTSLLRPLVVAMFVIIVFASILPGYCVAHDGTLLNSVGWLNRVSAATSLVLGFGYDKFSACNTATLALLVSGPTMGILLLALIGSVIVRRVYR